MPTIHTGVRPIFTFADEGLIEYEKIAGRKLGDILERLELGENANLQLASETFLPDDTARISFKVMEGILEPIIIVDIDRQKPRLEIEDLEREEQPLEEEIRLYYSPSIWIGTATVLHTKTEIGNNPNCGFFGYLPISRIWAFEPEGATAGESATGELYGYNNTTESHPGLTSQCGLPIWSFHHEGQPGALIDRELAIFNQTQYEYGQTLIDEGFFGDIFKDEAIIRSESGMTGFQGPGAYATTPRDALRSWGQSGSVGGFDDEEDVLAENYWLTSVIVAASYQFGEPSEEADGVITKQYTIPCIRTTDGVGSDAEGIVTTTEFPTGTIFNTVLSGSYEFNVAVEAWECECADSEVRVRLVIGERVAEIEAQSDELVTFQALVSVFDFVPEDIGNHDTVQQALCRDVTLGGHGLCEDEGERGMLDSNGRGIWTSAIYVNALAGTWEISAPTFNTPFFNETAGGEPCAQGKFGTPDDVNCQDCSFVAYQEQLGSGYANGGFDCIASGQSVVNTRTGVAFHFARVVGVEAPSNRICHVQLVGNDGGEGTCGDLPSYSYGHVFPATGIDPDIPIGADLSEFPTLDGGQFGTPGEIGGWTVGQLVVVIGLASSNCPAGSCTRLGAHKLLVSTPTAGGEDFRLQYWSQFRCANGVAFRNFIEAVEEQSRISTCAPNTPALTYQDLGNFGGFAAPTGFA